MKIFLSLCCMTLAMVLHPGVLNKESAAPFRTINIYQRGFEYSRFETMAITTLEELLRKPGIIEKVL